MKKVVTELTPMVNWVGRMEIHLHHVDGLGLVIVAGHSWTAADAFLDAADLEVCI
jgi:hypothetical protein